MIFSKKIVLVTGSSKGIGKSTALYFAKHGADVVVHYNSNFRGSQEIKKQILDEGRKCISIQADLRNIKQVEAMFHEIIKKFGRIDILVNNAGITEPEKYSETTIEKWKDMIDINLTSSFLCSQLAIPYFISEKTGCIVNVTSLCGKNGGLGAGIHYCASKAGMIGLTKAYANQLAQYNIRVNAVAPAMIDTEMIQWRSDDLMKEVIENIPLRRLGKPEEVAATIAFLSSERASFITGVTIDINGGMYMD